MDRITAAQVFVTIAERGSLTATAEQLDMSRAMVTRYLGEMEAWVGARLFHRSTRRISLSSAGEAALERCREMLALAGNIAQDGSEDMDDPRGILRIACAQSLAEASLAAATAAYLKRYPRASVFLQVADKVTNLVEERIDLAIRITNQLDPGMIARRLGECASVICAAPTYLAAHGTPQRAEDLARHNCLTYAYYGKSLWNFDRPGTTLSVPVSGNLGSNDSVVLMHAAIAGAGIAMQPVFSVAPRIARGELAVVLPDESPSPLGIHALYASREYQTATMRSMLDFLLGWFAEDENLPHLPCPA
ncbi:LysR family transcriptional regulator [Niveibacterium terrae]|uniref:LysR family transcriptional regulator n=1 Tax=Niveibacterium terrae TaxID=3373598 RepID=UPI003A93F58C